METHTKTHPASAGCMMYVHASLCVNRTACMTRHSNRGQRTTSVLVLICHLIWDKISCFMLIQQASRNSPVSAFCLAAGVLGLQRRATESGFMWILGILNTCSYTCMARTLPSVPGLSAAPGLILKWDYREFLWLRKLFCKTLFHNND